jgi:hypothetical protein
MLTPRRQRTGRSLVPGYRRAAGRTEPEHLFFTDGINGETGGLFGSITAVPEPFTGAMMLAGFGAIELFAARRRPTRVAIG